jgi:Tfp pilus assembly protein PilF
MKVLVLLPLILASLVQIQTVSAEEEPDPKKTAEFFSDKHKDPTSKREWAENGCQYGWYAISRGYLYSAERAFEKAIETDPSCGCGYFGLARIAKLRHQDAEADTLHAEAVKRDPSFASDANLKKLNAGPPVSQRTPQRDAQVATQMGWESFRKKDYAQAISYFEFAIKQDPSSAPGYFGIAYVYSVQNKLDKAVEYYRLSLKHDDTHADSYGNLAYALILQDKVDEAKKMLDEALKRDPKLGNAVMNFALYYAEKKDWAKAQEYGFDAMRRGATPHPGLVKEFEKHGINLKK